MDSYGTKGKSAATGQSDSAGRIAELERQVRALEQRCMAQAIAAPHHDLEVPDSILEALDAVESLVLILDWDGRILFINRACAQIAGCSASDGLGKCIWDFFGDLIPPNAIEAAFEQFRQGVHGEKLKPFSVIRKNKKYYLEWSSRVIHRADNKSPHVLVTGVDVTTRYEAQRSLKFQLRFERLVARVLQLLVSLQPDALEAGLKPALGELASFLEVETCGVWMPTAADKSLHLCCRWSRGEDDVNASFLTQPLVTELARLAGKSSLAIDSPAALAAMVPQIANSRDPLPPSFLLLPLVCEGRALGWLTAVSSLPRQWQPEIVRLATVIAELVGGSLERLRSQQALRDSEERMRSVVLNMPVMLCAIDALPDLAQPHIQYKLTVWNQECERVTGYRADEIVGNENAPALLLPSEGYREQFERDWRRAGHDLRNQEWKIRTKDGSIKTIAWTNVSERVPIPGWGAWGIGIDVTEQVEARTVLMQAHEQLEARVAARTQELLAANDQLKREIESRQAAERTLLRQTRILRAILESIADGVVVADESGKFIVFNRAAERIMHIGPVEAPPTQWAKVYGLYLPDCKTPYPVDQIPLVRAIQGESSFETLMFIDREGGPQNAWLSINACPLLDETGHKRGGVAVFRDITDSRRAHEQLTAEQELLQHLLRAHERDRQLLAYEIHDGLVQEITGALMHLEAYCNRAQLRIADDQDFYQGLKLLRVTIDEARRVITGLRPPILDEQGIVAAIEYLINEHTILDNVRIQFQHHIRAQRFDVLLDGTIYRIVQEALSNIRRHSGATRAEVALTQFDHRLRLEIRDNGKGFEIGRVTENRFGLEGIRERARLLRGTAHIESAPGRGTSILVELPLGLPQGNDQRGQAP